MSGFLGLITILVIWRESSSPICFQVLPASSLFHMPFPLLTFPLTVFSPVPTYITFGSHELTEIDPIEPPKKSSEIFFQVVPAFSLFQTPPPVDPK